ncbi:hypothetical protein FNYG_14819 [Fusarium nygamai]|uniref:Uncharacterized protein n=1 Tax=Gibberella nygamai TaxID=42673 RepID=A0A2K0UPX9_GIBNY|nr:hypothetical protein FNYG_14819 [Fusarium nygamai]
MKDFVTWISNTHDVNMHEDMNPNNVMLAAHNGGWQCQDPEDDAEA